MKGETYLGIKGHIICIDPVTGWERWRRHLKSGHLTTLDVIERNDHLSYKRRALWPEALDRRNPLA
jgi:hypothetical protein